MTERIETLQALAEAGDAAAQKNLQLWKQTTTLRQLFDEPDEEHKWVVEGMIPERSLNLLSAAPKVGKSTTSRCLAHRVATGGTFLGRLCTPSPVVYVSFEDRQCDVKAHLRSLGATGDEAIHFVFPEPGKDINSLVPELAKGLDSPLIIIDTLQRFIDAQDLNDYSEVTRLMTPLLALSRHAAVLCVHHANKGSQKGVNSVLGSQALAGSVANVFYMHKTDRYRIFGSDQRIGQSIDEFTVEYDPETGDVTAGPSKRTADINAVADELVDAMESGTQYTKPELLALVSTRRQTAISAVRTLVDSRRLRPSGTGKRNDPFMYKH